MSFFRKPTPLTVQEGGTGTNYFDAGYAVIGNGYSAFLELTPSTAGNLMTSNGTTWTSAPPSGGGSGTVNSGTAYQLAYYASTGTAVSTLGSLGTSGQVLTSGGAGVAPSWTTISGGASQATPTALGTVYGNTLSSGNVTTALGYQALNSNTGAGNVAIGYQAAQNNTSGLANIAIGQQCLQTNTTGLKNTSIGYGACLNNTSGGLNTALGFNSLLNNTTGSNNTTVGYQSGFSNTTGSVTALGYLSGYSNTTGNLNSFGYGACYSNTTGTRNDAFGYLALYNNTTGAENVAIGDQALYNNSTGADNTALGFQAGNSVTTSVSGIFIGAYCGTNVTTGSRNTYIGYGLGGSSSSVTDEIVLASGSGGTGKGSSTGFINPATGGVYQGNNSATWSVASDQRLKKNIVNNNIGLDKIAQIQVRNFEYRTEDEITDLPKNQVVKKDGIQLGAIAQELQQILPDCVKTESTGVMGLNTDNIMWHMINAIKELNAKVIQLESKLGI
jgi:hypothetical protein